MKLSSVVYKVGCWSFVLVGLGHIVTSMLIPNTPERVKMVQEMKSFSISMPGTESNLYLFHEGFSLMMGLLLTAYGLLNLAFAKISKMPVKSVMLINVAVSLSALIISIKYFFIVPVAFLGVAFLCFLIALALSFQSMNYSKEKHG
ncbi:Dipeptide transport system permease protein DppB (TC 3.A.1.5.2) [hydrothermal vent metagenome]|uniref:Dipeptide transport system permease protein DppB (TC 3.A.1.5.2) n=1 Tax=hydrothermal vent metagenome TaxID=652676 RepID=A0A3B0ZEL4_9ZZZZ